MTMNSAQIADLLRPGLKAVFGMLPDYAPQWPEIFQKATSDKAVEYEVEMKFLGLASERPEGAPTAQGTMGERIVTAYVMKTFGISMTLTQQSIEDNLYKDRFPMMARSLRKSMDISQEIVAASVLNQGFNTAVPIGDSLPFFSTLHPIDGGVVANTPSIQADLNEASLESAITAIQQFQDQAGLISMVKPKKLIVPPSNQYAASRLINSPYRVGTPNNDISVINHQNLIPQGYRVNQFLTLPNSWYLLTDCEGLRYYERTPLRINAYADMGTDNVITKATQRYIFGTSNFRTAYASKGP